MGRFKKWLLVWLWGSRWWLLQTEDRFGESSHQYVKDSRLHGERVLFESDVHPNNGQKHNGQDTQKGEEIFPGRRLLFYGDVLAD
jgi:hypothetical protein